ncbi:TPR-like repeat protein [Deinococcus phoenicis]|uniref:TPR-like repeat protein n=1 Tax=Deinococcus phoenicis TaxID=1476583 RepID=A0A016QSM7_9DEIO|nr:C39 family peptidase [Deinococcus phoenicis]EYB69100.1 TPR-like repeat protein [Deinococcus phoenicis]
MVPRAFVRAVLPLALFLTGPATALPSSVTLGKIRHELQGPDNCAPVTALTVLGYYGTQVTQAQAARALKDSPGDPQVTSLELAGYLGRFGLRSVIRYAGTPGLLRELLAHGVPVVLQQRLRAGSNVAHFRTVYGYRGRAFLVSDPLRGARLWLSEAELMDLWHFYNGEYLVAYPPAREGDVRAVLGEDFRAAANWQRLRRIGESNVRARPNDPYNWWGLGKANLRLGNVKAAAANFDRAVALGVPTLYFLYRQEAFEAWTQAGQHRKTLDLTQRALKTDPASKELLRFRNLARSALGG